MQHLMWNLVLILVLTCPGLAFGQGSPAPSADFCSALDKVVADAPNNFAKFIAELAEGDNPATLTLPGATSCSITYIDDLTLKSISYDCSYIETKKQEIAQEKFKEADALLTPCLASGWKVERGASEFSIDRVHAVSTGLTPAVDVWLDLKKMEVMPGLVAYQTILSVQLD